MTLFRKQYQLQGPEGFVPRIGADPNSYVTAPIGSVAPGSTEKQLMNISNTFPHSWKELESFTHFSGQPFMEGTGQDPYYMRGSRQGVASKLVRGVANLPMNIAAGVLELPINLVGFMGGDTNGVSLDFMKDFWGHVHRKDPNKVFDFNDLSSYVNSAADLTTSIASFAVPGAGVARGFAWLGNLAKGTRAARLANFAAKGLSAATMAGIEGAQVAQQMYTENFDDLVFELRSQGMGEHDAHVEANKRLRQAQWQTFGTNILLNTGLNMFLMAPFFRGTAKTAERQIRANMKAGESFQDAVKRLNQTSVSDAANFAKKTAAGGRRQMFAEMPQEALEELNNEFSAVMAMDAVKEERQNNYWENLVNADTWTKVIGSEEGAFSMIIGAIGGAGGAYAMPRIAVPGMRVYKINKDGSPEIGKTAEGETSFVQEVRWASTRRRDMNGMQINYLTAMEALSKDVTEYETLAAKIKGESNVAKRNQLMEKLFYMNAVASLERGFGDGWANTYRQIAAMDNTLPYADKLKAKQQEIEQLPETTPEEKADKDRQRQVIASQINSAGNKTEAQFHGFAENGSDNEYKASAEKAAKRMEQLSKEYEMLRNKYGGEEEDEGNYAGFMLNRKSQVLHLQEIENEYEQMVSDVRKRLVRRNLGAETVLNRAQVLQNIGTELRDDFRLIQSIVSGAVSPSSPNAKAVMDKYNISGLETTQIRESVQNALQNINDALIQNDQELERINYVISGTRINKEDSNVEEVFDPKKDKKLLDELFGAEISESFDEWQARNPDQTWDDFLRASYNASMLQSDLNDMEAELAVMRVRRKQAEAEFDFFETLKGQEAYKKAVDTYMDALAKEQMAREAMEELEKEDLGAELSLEYETALNLPSYAERRARLMEVQSKIAELQNEARKIAANMQELQDGSSLFNLSNLNKWLQLQRSYYIVQKKLAKVSDVSFNTRQQLSEIKRILAATTVDDVVLNEFIATMRTAGVAQALDKHIAENDRDAMLMVVSMLRFGLYRNPDGTLSDQGRIEARELIENILKGAFGPKTEAELRDSNIGMSQIADKIISWMIHDSRTHDTLAVLRNVEQQIDGNARIEIYDRVNPVLSQIQAAATIGELSVLANEEQRIISLEEYDEIVTRHGVPAELAMQHYIMLRYYVDKQFHDRLSLLQTAEAAKEAALNALDDDAAPMAADQRIHDGNISPEELKAYVEEITRSSPIAMRTYAKHVQGKPVTPTEINNVRTWVLNNIPNLPSEKLNAIMQYMFSPERMPQDIMLRKSEDVVAQRQRQNGRVVTAVGKTGSKTVQDVLFTGAKVEDMLKVQAITIESLHLGQVNPVTGQLEFRFREIKENIIQENIERIGKLKPHARITLRIDKTFVGTGRDWSGQLTRMEKHKGKLSNEYVDVSFASMVGPAGEIRPDAIEDFPIGVWAEDADGAWFQVGWLPRTSWITATIDTAVNYVHAQGMKSDTDAVEQLTAAKEKNMAIRYALMQAYNSNPTAEWELETTLASPPDGFAIEAGKPIRNFVFSTTRNTVRLEYDRAADLLPDPDKVIGVASENGTDVMLDKIGEKRITVDAGDMLPGAPYAVVKNWDGRLIAVPLTMDTIEGNDTDAVSALLKAYINRDEVIRRQWYDGTRLDILTPAGLRQAIQQHYTWVEKSPLGDHYYKNENALAVLDNGIVQIKAGSEIITLAPVNLGSQYSADYQELHDSKLRQAIGNRHVPVLYSAEGIQGVTSKEEYVRPVFKKGEFDFKAKRGKFQNYSAYLFTRANTTVYGRNTTEDGRFIYTSNPVMQLNPVYNLVPSAVMPTGAVVSAATGQTEVVQEISDLERYDDVFDEFDEEGWGSGIAPMAAPSVAQQPSSDIIPINIANLREMSNLAADNHNGKSVKGVYDGLRRQGLQFIHKDRNPFRICP